MKTKKAFSLVEIIIVLFIMAAVFFAIVPFSVSNIKQAKFIAVWKDYMKQVDYSYETLTEYQKENPLKKKEAFLRLMNYLDAKIVSKDEERIKNYSYKMMNGKFFHKIKLADFDEIYQDINGRLIGAEYKKICKEHHECIRVWIDLNGEYKPNVVGKDIFVYEISDNFVQPYGDGIEFSKLKEGCSPQGNGMYCSKYYLIGGDLQ